MPRVLLAGLLAAAPACSCDGDAMGGLRDAAAVDSGAGDATESSVDGSFADAVPGAPADAAPDAAAVLPAVRISEVVVLPRNDWSDELGEPYDDVPGVGAVDSRDELVELVNLGDEIVDLTGWSVTIADGSPATTILGLEGDLAFTAGSSLEALLPGGRLVVGDPDGYAATDAFVVLRDGDGRVIDDVEIGGLTAGRDFEEDGVGDGAPAGRNGFARGTFDEAIARPEGQPITGDDAVDFVAMIATPLAPNVAAAVPDEVVPPAVVTNVVGGAVPVSRELWIDFDETIDPLSADAAITVTSGGAPVALGPHTFDHRDRRVVLNPIGRLPFDAEVTVTVAGGAVGVRDRAGNPLAADHVFTVHTESAPASPAAILLNELCLDPRQDWGNSEGGDEVPFSATPGDGLVNSDDEWIELLVTQGGSSDLGSHTIVVYNGPNIYQDARATTLLGALATVSVHGSGTGISDVRGGDRVVVGNPSGSLFPSVWVELRDGAGVLLDAVEIGGTTSDSDRGGDGVDNGAPEPGASGRSTGLHDEVVARVPDGADTGDDIADFDFAAATPGW